MKAVFRSSHFSFRKAVAGAVVLAAVNGTAFAEEERWEAGTLWKSGQALFTEKGSRRFESDGPMLRSIRLTRRPLAAGQTCESAIALVKSRAIGEPFTFGSETRWSGWGDWEDDIDAVEKCSDFPCKIKFNEPETNAVAAKPKEARLSEVLQQIENRMKAYEKTAHRGGYDLPEDAVDPWKLFIAKGHVIPGVLDKSKPSFFARKVKFGEGSYRPLRQVFDERTFEEKNRLVRIARDVYTAHYFDGWGEWLEVRCSPEKKELLILQDLLMEFDLLKNRDFFSIIARPKMRQAVDQESLKYQKAQMDRIFGGP